jgi:hypothetical protein
MLPDDRVCKGQLAAPSLFRQTARVLCNKVKEYYIKEYTTFLEPASYEPASPRSFEFLSAHSQARLNGAPRQRSICINVCGLDTATEY